MMPHREIAQALDRFAPAALLRWRVALMAGLSTALGALLAGASASVGAGALVVGMLLCMGCSVFNQVQERRIDALMERTRNRPLASGALCPGTGLVLGGLLTIAALAGCALLGGVPALVAALVVPLLYNGMYTPLKRVSPHAILVGGIPGAMPPLLGWLLAGPLVPPESVYGIGALFAVYYLWQVPHFWCLAEKRRSDYARAGLAVAPVRMGRRYGLARTFWTAAFIAGLAASVPLGVVPHGPLRYAVLVLALLSGLAAAVQSLPRPLGTAFLRRFRVADAAMAAFLVLVSFGAVSG